MFNSSVHNVCFIQKVPIGGRSIKSVLSDRLCTLKSENNCYAENTFYMKQAVKQYIQNKREGNQIYYKINIGFLYTIQAFTQLGKTINRNKYNKIKKKQNTCCINILYWTAVINYDNYFRTACTYT